MVGYGIFGLRPRLPALAAALTSNGGRACASALAGDPVQNPVRRMTRRGGNAAYRAP